MKYLVVLLIMLSGLAYANPGDDPIQNYFQTKYTYEKANPEFRCPRISNTSHLGGNLKTDYSRRYTGGVMVSLYLNYTYISLGIFVGNNNSYTYTLDPSDFTEEEILNLSKIAFKSLNDFCVSEYEDYKRRMTQYKKRIAQ